MTAVGPGVKSRKTLVVVAWKGSLRRITWSKAQYTALNVQTFNLLQAVERKVGDRAGTFSSYSSDWVKLWRTKQPWWVARTTLGKNCHYQLETWAQILTHSSVCLEFNRVFALGAFDEDYHRPDMEESDWIFISHMSVWYSIRQALLPVTHLPKFRFRHPAKMFVTSVLFSADLDTWRNN